ncbi:MAG TPA: ElyC/SanA/YdcF family protein [Blastocatellia bacterium]|nr:ElyC/SanA/YdcF family protein [Blastocatellia bacterium]
MSNSYKRSRAIMTPFKLLARVPRTIRWIILMLVIPALLTVLFNLWIVGSTRSLVTSRIEELPANEIGLLLGAKPRFRTRPSAYFRGRIEAAARLYHSGKIKHLLVSGSGDNDGFNEPEEMKQELLSRGVPESALTLDHSSQRTLDSIVRAREVFGLTRVTIITDDFHTYRALFLGRHYGLNAVAYASIAGSVRPLSFNTSAKTAIREWFARVKAVLDLYLLPIHPDTSGPKIEIKISDPGVTWSSPHTVSSGDAIWI